MSSKEPWLGITYDRKQATTEKEEQLLRYGEKENRVSRSSQPGLPPVAITVNRSPLYCEFCDSIDWDRDETQSYRPVRTKVVYTDAVPSADQALSLPKCTGALPYPLSLVSGAATVPLPVPGSEVLNHGRCPVVFDSSTTPVSSRSSPPPRSEQNRRRGRKPPTRRADVVVTARPRWKLPNWPRGSGRGPVPLRRNPPPPV